MLAELAAGDDGLFPLIAENARTATGYGTCRICGRQVIRGEKIADLVTGETENITEEVL